MFAYLAIAGCSVGAAVFSARFAAGPLWLPTGFGALAVWSLWCGVRRGGAKPKPILTLGGFSWMVWWSGIDAMKCEHAVKERMPTN